MQAGKLIHRIQIQEPSDSRDAHGGITRTWSTVATVWGRIEPLSGRELFEAQKVESQARVKISLRPYSALTTKHRLIWTE